MRERLMTTVLAAVFSATITACTTVAGPVPGNGPGWLAVSANDNKVVLENGAQKIVKDPQPDTLALIDLAQTPPRLIAEINVPSATVRGPPGSVAISPDESLALISSGLKNNPADPSRQIDDNRVTVVDLKSNPPRVVGTVEAGAQPTGISITPDGKLALVANYSEGTVSVFSIDGHSLTKTDTVRIGDARTGTVNVVISPNGKTALVTRDGDHYVSVLSIENGKVEYARRDISAGIRPYGIVISPDGSHAIAVNYGRNPPTGDAGSLSVIDLTVKPYRVVNTVSVGLTPEGIAYSPDGRYLAVASMIGSHLAKESPFYTDAGKLTVFRVDGAQLSPAAQAPIGHWSQGVAFSPDSRTILVQNMIEKDLWVFAFDGSSLKDTGQRIKVRGGAAAIRTAPVR
jgi:DNA-binding beta-propeller fold protein YncE